MELAEGIINDEEAVKAVDMQSEGITDDDFEIMSARSVDTLTADSATLTASSETLTAPSETGSTDSEDEGPMTFDVEVDIHRA